jgi:hypothetical protein
LPRPAAWQSNHTPYCTLRERFAATASLQSKAAGFMRREVPPGNSIYLTKFNYSLNLKLDFSKLSCFTKKLAVALFSLFF